MLDCRRTPIGTYGFFLHQLVHFRVHICMQMIRLISKLVMVVVCGGGILLIACDIGPCGSVCVCVCVCVRACACLCVVVVVCCTQRSSF